MGLVEVKSYHKTNDGCQIEAAVAIYYRIKIDSYSTLPLPVTKLR